MERKNIIRLKLKVEYAWEKDEKKGINPIQIMREFSNLNPKHQNQSNGTRISCVVKLLLLLFPPFNLNIESIRFNVFFLRIPSYVPLARLSLIFGIIYAETSIVGVMAMLTG